MLMKHLKMIQRILTPTALLWVYVHGYARYNTTHIEVTNLVPMHAQFLVASVAQHALLCSAIALLRSVRLLKSKEFLLNSK